MIMGSRRNAVIVVVWVMLSEFVSAGRMGREGLFLGWSDSSRGSVIIDQGMVKQMWINCSLHLMNFDDFSLLKYIAGDSHETKRRARLILEGSTEEAMTLMSPEIKEKFMNCLSKQNFDVTEEDGTRNILTEFLNSLLGSNLASRRHLAYIPIRMMAPASAPSIAAAPSFALSVSLALAEAPTPSPGIDPPSSSPTPSLEPAPASTPAPTSAPTPSDLILAPPPESKNLTGYPHSSPDSHPVLPTKKQTSNSISRQILIAVVATATVVSLISGLLAFLCLRRTKSKSSQGHGLKDDDHFVALNDLYGSPVKPNKNASGASAFKGSKRHNMKTTEEPSDGFPRVTKCLIDQEGGNDSDSKLPLPPGQKADRPRPVPPPPPPNFKPSPQPPPPPKCASPPRPPPSGARVYRPSPLGPKKSGDPVPYVEDGTSTDHSAPKTKLKPFFWDKVQANTDQSMVWDQIKAGSFQFNEEAIESLFGYNIIEQQKSVGKKESASKEPAIQYIQLLEPKKAQNLAISLKAMNVKTEEICDALKEGTELPTDLLQTLMRMVPSTDEELKLRLYSGDLSLLGPAEQFLKTMVDIPFAFQRMDALLFKSSLQEDVSCTKGSYSTLEAACKEVRSSRIFLKLLEAVLKTGNRMNDGTYRGDAQAFKLDTLLKLSDVKGIDGKTTLLHFVVQEIIRSEGVRAARARARESRSITSFTDDDFTDDFAPDSGEYMHALGLKVVSGVCNELQNVKKAAGLDVDALTSTVASLGQRLVKMNEFMNTSMQSIEEESRFQQSLVAFLEQAEADITLLLEEEKRIRALVRSTTDYFHGSAAKDEGLRLFVIVREFLVMIDKVCKEIAESSKRAARTPRNRDAPNMSPARDAPNMSPVRDPRLLLFPAIRDQRIDYSSSDDED